MAWRSVVISKPARLNIENSQLLIRQENEIALPLEDIAVLMLESPEVILSSSLLNRLAENDVLLLVCDARHMPSLAGLPFAKHSRLAKVQKMQLETTLPFRKRCWQKIVQQKIANQAECLRLLECSEIGGVSGLIKQVGSGDPENLESAAAREYFPLAFGGSFVRGADDFRNSALNYGYAVLRGAVARALTSYGFLPAHGIHHSSELNQFNLADDFLEPYRPVIDLCVAQMEEQEGLRKEDRERLASLLYGDVHIDGKQQGVLHAVELTASSFHSACASSNPGLLKLPKLLPLRYHSYE